jgi:hypothetical protein
MRVGRQHLRQFTDHTLNVIAIDPDPLAHLHLDLGRDRRARDGDASRTQPVDDVFSADAEPPDEMRRQAARVPDEGHENVLRTDGTVSK